MNNFVKNPILQQDKRENLTDLEIRGGFGTQYQLGEMRNLRTLKAHDRRLVALETVILKILPTLLKLVVEG